MWGLIRPMLALGALLATFSTQAAIDAQSVLERAKRAVGTPETLRFEGSGTHALFGQSVTTTGEWPAFALSAVSVEVNFAQGAWRQDITYRDSSRPGGATQIACVTDTKAWSIGPRGDVIPQVDADDPPYIGPEERRVRLWMTPQGFLRAALAASDVAAKTVTGSSGGETELSFTALGKYRFVGSVDAAGRLTRISTTYPARVLGDIVYEYRYSDYRRFNGIQFPTRIVLVAGGSVVDDWRITRVEVGRRFSQPVPQVVVEAPAPEWMHVDARRIDEGVWYLSGGSHGSFAVEFADFITIIEAPIGDARSRALMTKVSELVPGKPIRYVVNSHHHFDHAGGLRAFVAAGVTVVTDLVNRDYYEKAFSNPATTNPDEQTMARSKPKIEGVNGTYTITDGSKAINVYSTSGYPHSDNLTLSYILPARILVEADMFSPGSRFPAPIGDMMALHRNIEGLRLEPLVIGGIHGTGPLPYADFREAVAAIQAAPRP